MNKTNASLALPIAGLMLVVGFFAPWAIGISAWDMFTNVKTGSGSVEVYFFLAALAAIPVAGLLFMGSIATRGMWAAATGSALLVYAALYGLQLLVRAAWAISSWGIITVVLAGLFAVGATLFSSARR